MCVASNNFSIVMQIRCRYNLDTSAALASTLFEACKADAVSIFHSYTGDPVGYIASAKVSKYTLRMLSKRKTYRLGHSSEWNDGYILYLVDWFIASSYKEFVRFKVNRYLEGVRLLCYYRKGELRLLSKVRWAGNSHRFKLVRTCAWLGISQN